MVMALALAGPAPIPFARAKAQYMMDNWGTMGGYWGSPSYGK